MVDPRVVAADMLDHGRMYYLVDGNLDFIPEVKEFLDWKLALRRAPATRRAYCHRLWYLCAFLQRRGTPLLAATPVDLVDFLIWLGNPYRDAPGSAPSPVPRPLEPSTINHITRAAGGFYKFAVRRGWIAASPVAYVDVPRGTWLTERDLLAHTRRGDGAATVKRSELILAVPAKRPKVVSDADFATFLTSIAMDPAPDRDPAGFRDRLIALVLKEGGFRLGELAGMRVDDIEMVRHGGGLHVRFRPDNANGARAKAGYGRDRFVHLGADVLGLIDLYLSEVWVRAAPRGHHLWAVVRADATDRAGHPTLGTALHGDRIRHMFQHYSRKSGVSITPHMLRHTHATALVRSFLTAGEPVDWKFVQERLGHASVVTTMETYTHLEDDDRRLSYLAFMDRREGRRADH